MSKTHSKPSSGFFATTQWTRVVDAAHGADTTALNALGELMETYWQPLYRYARRKGKSKEDAEDLVQGFMLHITKANALDSADREKGRFRAFLLACFNHWMTNEWRHASRQKRGGGETPISLDWESAETGLSLDPADERSPDLLYDREWALALLAKVLAELETSCIQEGNGNQFTHLKPCLTADSSKIPYSKISEKLGIEEGALRVAVHRLRKRYRTLLTQEVSRTLSSPETVDEEMRSLFAALSH
ncbi:MAG: RNA polymerase sigma factor [Luteolibacter sp.]